MARLLRRREEVKRRGRRGGQGVGGLVGDLMVRQQEGMVCSVV